MINAVIIDDEINACLALKKLIELLNIPVNILGEAHTIIDGIDLIDTKKPDLVFLDIQLPTGTSFEILDKIKHKTLQVIFITAYNEYAIQSFKYSTVDYLLKPIASKDLVIAIEKAMEVFKLKGYEKKIETLLSNNSSEKNSKIVLNTTDNYRVIDLNLLMYCLSDGSYTHFIMLDGSKITATKTLKSFIDILEDFGLYRIFRSHVINLKYVTSYTKGLKPMVTMSNGIELEISREIKSDFFKLMEGKQK